MNIKRLLVLTGTVLSSLTLVWMCLFFLSGPSEFARAASDTYTVCSAGWPTCDYDVIQDAVDAAVDGDTIKIAEGTYTGVNDYGGLSQVVYIAKSIIIKGGYQPGKWTTPDPGSNHTTIDAGRQGRGLYITGNINPTIEGLRITGGYAKAEPTTMGGGIWIDQNSTATLRNNYIYSNTASYGGGGLGVVDSSPSIIHNTFISNTVDYEGGGLAVYSSDAMIRNNTIISNTAHGWGGGLFVGVGSAKLYNNSICNNLSHNSGGGLVLDFSSAVLTNNIICDNQANADASGIRISDSFPRLFHNTVARNLGGDGVGIYIDHDESISSTVLLTNTIIVSHTVGIYVEMDSDAVLNGTFWGGGIWGNADDWIGFGNVFTSTDVWGDPDFVDYQDGNYHIGENSDAINAGVDAGVTTDIDFHPRPYQLPDIGADEYWPPGALKLIYLPLVIR
jgi:hypothetical protein